MVFKGKIEELGEDAQKEVIKLGVEGLSNGAIADRLNEKHQSDISSGAVGSFRKRNKIRDKICQFKSGTILYFTKRQRNKVSRQNSNVSQRRPDIGIGILQI